MSLETTMARAAERGADEDWQRHRKMCAHCEPAARKRQWKLLCAAGAELKSGRDELRAEALRQAELDKAPNPDQAPLFDVEA
jgi:hypothetical protein